MKICVLGPNGRIGSAIVQEALSRGHEVTGVSRHASTNTSGIRTIDADASAADQLLGAIHGQDVVVSGIGPSAGEPPSVIVDVTRALAAACTRAEVRRVVVIGSAGSLAVSPGLELLATPDFPPQDAPVALAHHEALDVWRHVKRPDWTYVSPAMVVTTGERMGKYRVGHDALLRDAQGNSTISTLDLALAVVDEVENHSHSHERIGIAY